LDKNVWGRCAQLNKLAYLGNLMLTKAYAFRV